MRCLVAIALAALSSPVYGEQVALVVRLPPPSPATLPEVLDAFASAGSVGGDEVVRAPFELARTAIAAGAVRSSRLRAFSRSLQLVREGRNAYQSADLQFATGRLAEARRVALEVADLPGGRDLIADASIALGAARFDLGDSRYAADFGLAARLAPDRRVTTFEFKPIIVTAFEEARAVGKKGASHPLVIEAPGSERIEVDGGAVNIAEPIIVSAGLHLVLATAGAREPAAALVTIPRAGTLKLKLEPAQARERIAEGRSSLRIGMTRRELGAAVAALTIFADVDAVVVASAIWRRGQATLVAERCSGIPARCTRSVEVRYGDGGGLSAAAREMWRALKKERLKLTPGLLLDARVAGAEGPPGSTPPTTQSPWYRSPLLWAGVGASAVVVVGAIIFFAEDDPKPAVVIGSDLFPAR